MNPAIKSLRDDFDSKTTEAQSLTQTGKVEDLERAGELKDEAKAIKSRIEKLMGIDSELDALKSWDKTPGLGDGRPAAQVIGVQRAGEAVFDIKDGAIKSMVQAGEGVLTPKQLQTIQDSAYKSALNELIRAKGDKNEVSRDALKSLTEGIDADGGQLVGIEMASQILMRQPAITELAGLATTYTTSRDNLTFNSVPYSADNRYTTGIRVRKAGEKPKKGSITVDNPVFGSVSIPVHTFMMELGVSNDLLEDASIDIEGFLSSRFQETVDLFDEDMMANGNGIHEPRGMLHDAGADGRVQLIKAGGALLNQDALQKLKFSIPRQYSRGSGLRFAFNSTSTGLALASLKDENKRALWPMEQQAGLVGDVPANLLGHFYNYSDFLPDIAPNALPILFGNFKGYTRLRRVGFSIKFLREVGYAENETIIIARYRMGGDLTEPWMLRALEMN